MEGRGSRPNRGRQPCRNCASRFVLAQNAGDERISQRRPKFRHRKGLFVTSAYGPRRQSRPGRSCYEIASAASSENWPTKLRRNQLAGVLGQGDPLGHFFQIGKLSTADHSSSLFASSDGVNLGKQLFRVPGGKFFWSGHFGHHQ